MKKLKVLATLAVVAALTLSSAIGASATSAEGDGEKNIITDKQDAAVTNNRIEFYVDPVVDPDGILHPELKGVYVDVDGIMQLETKNTGGLRIDAVPSFDFSSHDLNGIFNINVGMRVFDALLPTVKIANTPELPDLGDNPSEEQLEMRALEIKLHREERERYLAMLASPEVDLKVGEDVVVPYFVQVGDRRFSGEGWSLFAELTEQFTRSYISNENGTKAPASAHVLAGSKVTLSSLGALNHELTEDNEFKAREGVITLVELGDGRGAHRLATAEHNTGMGRNSLRFGNVHSSDTELGLTPTTSDVQLNVPTTTSILQGTYHGTIQWTLTNAPATTDVILDNPAIVGEETTGTPVQ